MKRLLVLPILLVAVACAASGANKSSSSRTDRNRLTVEDLSSVGAQDAWTVVQSLRPHWLNKRGQSTINLHESIKVYLDGSYMGDDKFLKNISVTSIRAIQYMNGLEATQRFGLDHGSGAILVITRVGPN